MRTRHCIAMWRASIAADASAASALKRVVTTANDKEFAKIAFGKRVKRQVRRTDASKVIARTRG